MHLAKLPKAFDSTNTPTTRTLLRGSICGRPFERPQDPSSVFADAQIAQLGVVERFMDTKFRSCLVPNSAWQWCDCMEKRWMERNQCMLYRNYTTSYFCISNCNCKSGVFPRCCFIQISTRLTTCKLVKSIWLFMTHFGGWRFFGKNWLPRIP